MTNEILWKDSAKRHIKDVFVSSLRSQVDSRKMKRNGIIIAEALARYMYNFSDKVIEIPTNNWMHLSYLHILWLNIPSSFYCVINLDYILQGFTKRYASFQGSIGKLASLFCSVKRNASADLLWFKDGSVFVWNHLFTLQKLWGTYYMDLLSIVTI